MCLFIYVDFDFLFCVYRIYSHNYSVHVMNDLTYDYRPIIISS